MLKRMMPYLIILVVSMIITGCTTSKEVTMRSYFEDRQRVDQNLQEGNAGYVYGSPKRESQEERKQTRKIFVLEVSEAPDEVPDAVYRVETPAPAPSPKKDQPRAVTKKYYKQQEIEIPDLDEIEIPYEPEPIPPSDVQGSFVEYKVEKNDTLQKISKKFYDSYSKWPKIYSANKDQLKNPDYLKPGIILKIPVEK